MQKQDAHALGTYLRSHREAKSLSARALAAAVGIDMAQIVRLEHGQVASPKADVLSRIAGTLELPLADVFGLAGYTTPAELPSFRPYMRAKYHRLPEDAVAELESLFAEIARKYGTSGPRDGEDEH